MEDPKRHGAFPLPVFWNARDREVADKAYEAFVDEAIAHFARHGTGNEWMTAEYLEGEDEDEDGVALTAVDPYGRCVRYRIRLTFLNRNGGGLALLVNSIERI
jgi:hypothetical protein